MNYDLYYDIKYEFCYDVSMSFIIIVYNYILLIKIMIFIII